MQVESEIRFVIRRFRLAVGFMLSILVIGALGYILIEGYNPLDAIYMTAITVVAVGYREIGQLGFWGRIFTMVLIFGGLTAVALWVSAATSLYVQRELSTFFRKRKMEKDISRLKGHTVQCGAGDTGRQIVEQFRKANEEIVVIEKESEPLAELKEHYPDVRVIEGDATKEEILLAANVVQASNLITTLAQDTDNLFVVISARYLNPKVHIIARAVDRHTSEKLIKVGADHVVTPSVIEGMRMATMALSPTVVTFMDMVRGGKDVELELEEVVVPDGSHFADKTLRELEIPQRTGLIVIATTRDEGEQFNFNPISSTVLRSDDRLVVLGKKDQIKRLKSYVQGN